MSASRDPKDLHPETRLIHAGTLRSQFGETSEALFLTQGFVYDSAAPDATCPISALISTMVPLKSL